MTLRPDDVTRPTNLRLRRFIAKYMLDLEVTGYLFVLLIGSTIAALWIIQVDDVAKGSRLQPDTEPEAIRGGPLLDQRVRRSRAACRRRANGAREGGNREQRRERCGTSRGGR